jgi:hypothetical protein
VSEKLASRYSEKIRPKAEAKTTKQKTQTLQKALSAVEEYSGSLGQPSLFPTTFAVMMTVAFVLTDFIDKEKETARLPFGIATISFGPIRSS